MTQDIGYVFVAYVGSAVLYGVYVTWLLRKERRLERSEGGDLR
jgi:hypothetical protein